MIRIINQLLEIGLSQIQDRRWNQDMREKMEAVIEDDGLA